MESNLKIEEERIETISNRVIRTFQKRSDFIPSLKFFISKSNRLAESNSKERRIERYDTYRKDLFIYIYICTRKKSCEKYRRKEEKEKRNIPERI